MVDIDLPALEGYIVADDLLKSCFNWRRKGEIIFASGTESDSTEISPEAWWNDGVIWEQSILRVNNPDQFEERVRALDVERHLPHLPERPYDFERAVCFVDIQLNLEELAGWSTPRSAAAVRSRRTNSRGAGMKQTEDYDAIETRLWELIKEDKEWDTWTMVWVDVRDLFKDPEAQEKSDQPSKKLTEHLKANAQSLYEKLRGRIASVRSKKR